MVSFCSPTGVFRVLLASFCSPDREESFWLTCGSEVTMNAVEFLCDKSKITAPLSKKEVLSLLLKSKAVEVKVSEASVVLQQGVNKASVSLGISKDWLSSEHGFVSK